LIDWFAILHALRCSFLAPASFVDNMQRSSSLVRAQEGMSDDEALALAFRGDDTTQWQQLRCIGSWLARAEGRGCAQPLVGQCAHHEHQLEARSQRELEDSRFARQLAAEDELLGSHDVCPCHGSSSSASPPARSPGAAPAPETASAPHLDPPSTRLVVMLAPDAMRDELILGRLRGVPTFPVNESVCDCGILREG
jgi:hypothetical protein